MFDLRVPLVLSAVVIALIVTGVYISMGQVDEAAADCGVVHGVFVNNRGYECWSKDGKQRLFPSDRFHR